MTGWLNCVTTGIFKTPHFTHWRLARSWDFFCGSQQFKAGVVSTLCIWFGASGCLCSGTGLGFLMYIIFPFPCTSLASLLKKSHAWAYSVESAESFPIHKLGRAIRCQDEKGLSQPRLQCVHLGRSGGTGACTQLCSSTGGRPLYSLQKGSKFRCYYKLIVFLVNGYTSWCKCQCWSLQKTKWLQFKTDIQAIFS